MLKNIEPNRKRSKAGSLTTEEKNYAKTLLNKGYVVQDIAFIINQGRDKTVNQSVIQLCANDKYAVAVSDIELKHYLIVQSAYDPKTLLNPHKDARLIKARESMISAVQIFNSPTINFKAEIYCVLANIAWTYLLHERMERIKKGSSKLENGDSITVGSTLNKDVCPIDNPAAKDNLRLVIKIRDEVEHTFFVGGEECFGPLFQSCCLNFEHYMTEWFGNHLSLTKNLSLALQFVRLSKEQITQIEGTNFPEKIKSIISEIQNSDFVNNNAFQLNVNYSLEATSKTNADLHKLIDYKDTPNREVVVIKHQNATKLTQDELIKKVESMGYPNFENWDHQQFWMERWPTAALRNKEATEYGELVIKRQWLWYEQKWLPEVMKHCEENKEKYK